MELPDEIEQAFKSIELEDEEPQPTDLEFIEPSELRRLQSFRKENKRLQTQLAEIMDAADDVANDYETLQVKYETLQGKFEAVKQENEALQGENEALKQENKRFQTQLEEIMDEADDMVNDYEALKQENETLLKGEKPRVKINLPDGDLLKENQRLKTSLHDLREAAKEVVNDSEELQEEFEALQKEYDRTDGNYDRIINECIEMVHVIDDNIKCATAVRSELSASRKLSITNPVVKKLDQIIASRDVLHTLLKALDGEEEESLEVSFKDLVL